MPLNKKAARWSARIGAAAIAPLVILTAPGIASAQTSGCLNESASYLTGQHVGINKSYSEGIQQASNTWQDWVWRGPTFKCPSAVTSCTYAWQKSHTQGWYVETGLSIPFGGGASLVPNYGHTESTTTSYTWTIYMKPGQYGQPIQIVDRRWRQGDIVGAWVRANSCTGYAYSGYHYNWDGGLRWDKWSDNVATDNGYGTYNVYS